MPSVSLTPFVLAVVLAFVVAFGCTKRPIEAPVPAAPGAARAVSAPPATLDLEVARLSLGERLAHEATTRPAATIRSEEVLAAFERGGIALARSRQVLASTIGAAYCTNAVSRNGVALAVCEFSAEEAARRGLEYSRATFDALIPGRTLLVNRNTMLTVTPPKGSAAGTAEVKIASAVFAELSPPKRK